MLYGTGCFLLGAPPAALIEESEALPLGDDVKRLWLAENARRVLGETAAAVAP